MKKKCLAIGIILLFIGTAIIPISGQKIEKISLPTSRGNTLYVGGSGPGNYTRIQDAINDSHDGDTVFVYSGVYDESIVIPTAIKLVGESRNTTILEIKNSDEKYLIYLEDGNITISGFTLRCTGDLNNILSIISSDFFNPCGNVTISNNIFEGNKSDKISLVNCNFCTIAQNIFLNYWNGIMLSFGKKCSIINNILNTTGPCGGILLADIWFSTISNNSIISNSLGLSVVESDFNTISNNYFFNNIQDITIDYSKNNSILSNRIEKTIGTLDSTSIQIYQCSGTLIEKNFISHAKFGIFLENSEYTVISMNTFMKNIVHARFYDTLFGSHTIWNQNYWGRPRVAPKPIFGIKDIYRVYPGFVEFDWHPAKKPYDIPGVR